MQGYVKLQCLTTDLLAHTFQHTIDPLLAKQSNFVNFPDKLGCLLYLQLFSPGLIRIRTLRACR